MLVDQSFNLGKVERERERQINVKKKKLTRVWSQAI